MPFEIQHTSSFSFNQDAGSVHSLEGLVTQIREKPEIGMLLSDPGLNKKINDVYEDQTPLYIAASLGKADIVSQLIRAGADPCKGHLESANSPLHIAASQGDRATVNALLQSSSVPEAVSQRNKDGKTPLHLAAENGHVDVLRMLIAATRQHIPERAREIIDAYAQDGRSPLLAAARAGHHHVVELLAEAGADLHSSLQGVKGMSGTNAVYMAAQQGHIKVIETLVDILKNRKASGEDIKAFIDVKPEHGFTPLLAAITSKGKDPGIVKLLVKLGADIRHSVRGWTNSIHYAAQLGEIRNHQSPGGSCRQRREFYRGPGCSWQDAAFPRCSK